MDREGSFNGRESDVSLCAALFSHLDQRGSASFLLRSDVHENIILAYVALAYGTRE